MKTPVMYGIAIAIAAFAAILAWLDPVHGLVQALALFSLAFIFCLAGLADAIHRCANALEEKKLNAAASSSR